MSKSLSEFFQGIGAKRLSEVEIKPVKSNQHEFNGISSFKQILGTEKKRFKGKFIYLSDIEENAFEESGTLTWYDAREKHATRTEHRLYYSSNEVILASSVGDLVVIGKTKTEDELIIIIAPKGSTSEKQLLWLFNLAEIENKFIVKDLSEEKADMGFAGKYIMASLGIEITEAPEYDLGELLRTFGKTFPPTNAFSSYARSTIGKVSPVEAPDETLIAWLEREELLFKALENVIVKEKLKSGFGDDKTNVDEFISFSLSVQNRRKSRAGHSFENHLAVIFDNNKITYDKGRVTERNNKPDFLFPKQRYHSEDFDIGLLTMLGVKTTAKDRWRQVLSEADKIPQKHLITLEPAISKNQTDEMIAQRLNLVIPKSIIPTYQLEQQKQIICLSDFIKIVAKNQSSF